VVAGCYGVLQCVAVCCSVLQCVAVGLEIDHKFDLCREHGSFVIDPMALLMQCVAVCCMLWCVAVCCSIRFF